MAIQNALIQLNKLDGEIDEYFKMRKETVYPAITLGLSKCTKASAAWKKIQDAIDNLDKEMIEKIWNDANNRPAYEEWINTAAASWGKSAF